MRLTLINKKKETSDGISFFLKSEIPLKWQAGQFLLYTVYHSDPDDRTTRRYFTIASAPFEEYIMVTTRFVKEKGSTFKHALYNLPIGVAIGAEQPDGDFVIGELPIMEYVFIAGGIGITPYRVILLDLDHRKVPINVTLLYSNRTPELVYKTELEYLAKKHHTLQIHYLMDPERITEETVKKLVPALQIPIFYVSGPEQMVEAFEKMLPALGILQDRVRLDYFPGYDCP
jgi:ferredoxin-NADP reductase